MTRVRNNGGIVGPNFSPNTSYQSGIWSITEHQKFTIGNPTFWNHATLALDLLVVGGGGAGGYGRGAVGSGGGGAGGVVYHQNVPIEKNTTYTIVIGAATARQTSGGAQAGGNDSSINGTFYGYTNNTIVGIGGGFGAAPVQCQNGYRPGGAGGSGGGGAACGGGAGGSALQPAKTMVPSGVFIGGNYGNPGVASGGGGGGAGAAASGASGGAGIQVNINGTATYYAGGGGAGGTGGGAGGGGTGGCYWSASTDGGTNLGGGGGAGGSAGAITGGAGGSGVVIFNYPNTFGLAVSSTGSPTQTYYGSNIVYTFASSGTIAF